MLVFECLARGLLGGEGESWGEASSSSDSHPGQSRDEGAGGQVSQEVEPRAAATPDRDAGAERQARQRLTSGR